MKKLSLVAAAAVVGTVAAIGLGFNTIGQALGPTCQVAVAGTRAVVVVQGWSSPQVCRELGPVSAAGRNLHFSCSATVAGSRAGLVPSGLSPLASGRLCASLLSDGHGGVLPLPAVSTRVDVTVREHGGSSIASARVTLRDSTMVTVTDATGHATLNFAGGYGPDTLGVAASADGYTSENHDVTVTKFLSEVPVTVEVGYLAPSGAFVERPSPGVWYWMDISDTTSGHFSGTATRYVLSCTSTTYSWDVTNLFVGRTPGKDEIRVGEQLVPITGIRKIPTAWVANEAPPDPNAPPPPGAC